MQRLRQLEDVREQRDRDDHLIKLVKLNQDPDADRDLQDTGMVGVSR